MVDIDYYLEQERQRSEQSWFRYAIQTNIEDRQRLLASSLADIRKTKSQLLNIQREREKARQREATRRRYAEELGRIHRQQAMLAKAEVTNLANYLYARSAIMGNVASMQLSLAAARGGMTPTQIAEARYSMAVGAYQYSMDTARQIRNKEAEKALELYWKTGNIQYLKKHNRLKEQLLFGQILPSPTAARNVFEAALEAYQRTGNVFYREQAQTAITAYQRAEEQRAKEVKQKEDERISLERQQLELAIRRLEQEQKRAEEEEKLKEAIDALKEQEKELQDESKALKKEQADLTKALTDLKDVYERLSTHRITVKAGGETVTATIGPAGNTATPY